MICHSQRRMQAEKHAWVYAVSVRPPPNIYPYLEHYRSFPQKNLSTPSTISLIQFPEPSYLHLLPYFRFFSPPKGWNKENALLNGYHNRQEMCSERLPTKSDLFCFRQIFKPLFILAYRGLKRQLYEDVLRRGEGGVAENCMMTR